MSLNYDVLDKIANTIRGLSMDAVEAANSGHPGLPLGCAELMAYLYGVGLNYNSGDSSWVNRDRFVLSAGHGSIALYSALHLSGFDVTLEDIKLFRQLNSKTAGHPEFGHLDGVETTTGPLGQGLSSAVGMALSNKMLAEKFSQQLFDSSVVVLVGDGCMMEGITSEASSFAGHLSLDNLIVIYDSNDVCLDGPTDECFSENTALRYEAYGWAVETIDGHSFDQIHHAFQVAKQSKKPTLIIAKTVIGKGAKNVEGTSEAHGKPLGQDAIEKVKLFYNIPSEPLFYVPDDVKDYFLSWCDHQTSNHLNWQERFNQWAVDHPKLADEYHQSLESLSIEYITSLCVNSSIKPNVATRVQSSELLQSLAVEIPNLIGGSADLSCSDNTLLKEAGIISAHNFSGQNIKYGVREFAMASIASGIALTKFFRVYIGTFLIFSDYMRNAIRLSAMMSVPVIYQFTHDSIFLGEDGPTHQPIEQLASLRAMPNLTVCRPADEDEVRAAWILGLSRKAPTAIVLTRQKVKSLEETNVQNALKGGYILYGESNSDISIFATGSECELAINVAKSLEKEMTVKVVSLMSWEVFNEQNDAYKRQIIGESRLNVSIEAQSSFGWERFIGNDGLSISIDQFGASGKASDIKEFFRFSEAQVLETIMVHYNAVMTSK